MNKELFDELKSNIRYGKFSFREFKENLKKIEDLSKEINALDEQGYTLLHYAVDDEDDYLEFARLLLELGADPNLRGYGGCTPFFRSVNNHYDALFSDYMLATEPCSAMLQLLFQYHTDLDMLFGSSQQPVTEYYKGWRHFEELVAKERAYRQKGLPLSREAVPRRLLRVGGPEESGTEGTMDFVRDYPGLQSLTLHTIFSSIGPEIRELKYLRDLLIEKCPIKDESFEILCSLTGLDDLIFSFTKITHIPEEIQNLQALESLTVRFSKLARVSAQVFELPALKTLYLPNNCLRSLPETSRYTSPIEELSLCDNKLTTLPVSLGNLSRLRHLDLSSNSLASVPLELLELPQLWSFRLGNNQLTQMPGFHNVTLSSLNLRSNSISHLPEFQAPALSNLFLDRHTFFNTPAEHFQHCPRLRNVSIKGDKTELNASEQEALTAFQAVCPDAKVRFVPCVQRVDVERLLRNNGLNGSYGGLH